MQALLYANLTEGTLSQTLGGSQYSFPTLIQGDELNVALRFSEQLEGENVEVARTLDALRAGIGRVDARPTGGTITLSVDDGTTSGNLSALTYDFTATNLSDALDTLGIDYNTATEDNDTFIINSDVELTVAIASNGNDLTPATFLRQNKYSQGGKYFHELRLQQAPVAFSETWSAVVPPSPTIATVEDGTTVDETDIAEVQNLTIPPSFRGIFTLSRGAGQVTSHLNRASTAAEIKAALDEIADEGGYFTVSTAYAGTARIAFEGTMAGTNQGALTVTVVDAPPGDPTITLSLDTSEVSALFRNATEVTIPLEIEAEVQDVNTPATTYTYTLFRDDVTIKQQVVRDEDHVAQEITWQNPPRPTDYIPYESDQIITGSQHYTFQLTAASTAVAHNLGTTNVHVTLVDNTSGEVLDPSDYTATVDSANQITFDSFTSAPSGGAPVDGVISTAGPVAAFQAHTHTIAQVTNLQTTLDSLGARITALEAMAPSTPLTAADEPSYSESWDLPTYFEVFPLLGTAGADIQAPSSGRLADLDKTQLPTLVPTLLPAIHTTSATALPVSGSNPSPPVPANAGTLYRNDTGVTINIPLNSQLVSEDDPFGFSYPLATGEYATHDGTNWYPLVQYGTAGESSYYPRPLERTLWQDTISSSQLAAGRRLEIRFALEVAAIRANTLWHWYMVIETAQLPAASTPGTPGGNLSDDDWEAASRYEQRLVLGSVPRRYNFGYRVTRAAGGSLSAEGLAFGEWSAATAPDSAEFALRVRLVRADTVDRIANPRGFLAVSGFIDPDNDTVGKATIS